MKRQRETRTTVAKLKRQKSQLDDTFNGSAEKYDGKNDAEERHSSKNLKGKCPYRTPLENGYGFNKKTYKFRCNKECENKSKTQRILFSPSSSGDKYERTQRKLINTRATDSFSQPINSLNLDEPDFIPMESSSTRRNSDSFASYNQHNKSDIPKGSQALFSNTYPGSKRGQNTTYTYYDVETDIIIAEDVCDKYMPHAPAQCPQSYIGMNPKDGPLPRSNSFFRRLFGLLPDKGPDQNSTIYIPHEYADEPQGDKFGVDVWTYNIKQKDGTMYYQHYFVDVDFDGPADKMKIRENDEIVLVNGIFVPQITHIDLLNLFHEVKVDGKTRLRLVIRRVKKCTRGSKKEWEWIDTSAVLAPGVHEETDNYPKVERAEYHSHTGDAIEFPPCIMEYNVPGTQYFVDVKNEQVTVSAKKGTAADKTKRICKRSLYKCGSDGNVHYFGALSNEQKDRYISIGTEHEIKLNVSPMWFEFKKDGSGIWFRTNDLFLSCNRSTRKLKADKVKFLFAESSLENGVDCPDGCSSAVESLQPVRMVTRSTVPATHGNRPVSIVAAVNDASYGCFGPGASVDRNTYAAGHDSHKRAENSDRAVTLHIPRNGHISTTPSPCDSLKTPTTPMAALFLAN